MWAQCLVPRCTAASVGGRGCASAGYVSLPLFQGLRAGMGKVVRTNQMRGLANTSSNGETHLAALRRHAYRAPTCVVELPVAVLVSTEARGLRGVGAGLGAWYYRMLETRPVLTKSVTSALICAAGDATCQLAIEGVGPDGYDFLRTGRFATIGMCLVGPVMHNWFGLLARIYPDSLGSTKVMLCKVATDQAIMAPLFNPLFVAALYTLEGRPQEVVPTLRIIYVVSRLCSCRSTECSADCVSGLKLAGHVVNQLQAVDTSTGLQFLLCTRPVSSSRL